MKQMTSFYYTLYEADDVILLYTVEADDVILLYTV